MPFPRALGAARSLLVLGLAAALAAPVVGRPTPAAAEELVAVKETVVGELTQAWPEHRDHAEATARGDDGPLSFVRTTAGGSVRVATEDVEGLSVGATVQMTVGRAVTDEASREDGYEKARDVLATKVLAPPPAESTATAPAGTTINHPVSVVMVVPQGGTRDGTTLAQLVAEVDGPVADFWAEESDGTVNIGVVAQRDWVTLDIGCQDPWALWSAAARAVGFTDVSGQADHLLVYVSSQPADLAGCSDGLGTVGSSVGSGGYSYVRHPSASIITHELGHNFGLGHSSLLQCDGTTNTGGCRTTPYLDLYDVMGASWGRVGSLNVAQAHDRITQVDTVSVGVGTSPERPVDVTLVPVSTRDGVRGVQLGDGGGRTYWLEYRPPSGRDAWLGTAENRYGLESGVLLRQRLDGDDTSVLLDGSPSPRSAWSGDLDSALPVGTPIRVHGWRDAGVLDITVTGMTESAATVRIVPTTAITLAYETSGGVGGPMGAAVWDEQQCALAGSTRYCERSFQNGSILWTPTIVGGARLVHGPVFDAWTAGGSLGTFGLPVTDTSCGLTGGGCRQQFVSGNVYWSPGTGAVAVHGALRTAYVSVGQEAGVLGYPTAAQVCGTAGVCRQDFQGGTLVTGLPEGPRLVPGGIRAVWASSGYESGLLGQPVTGQICGMKESGCVQVFQGGRVYTTPGTGAHALSGAVLRAWIGQNWELGPMGYPTGGQVCGPPGGGCTQEFQGGTLSAHPEAGTHVVSGPLGAAWAAAGAGSGALGHPVTGPICGMKETGCVQVFQGGRIYHTPGTGAHPLSGPILDAWVAQRWELGPLGYATGGQVCDLPGGGCTQEFQGGTLYSDGRTVHSLSGPIRSAWVAQGAQAGPLGRPTLPLLCGLKDGACAQAFSGGILYSSPASGTHPISGGVAEAWFAQGYERGPLGYPVTGLICGMKDSGCVQVFQGGRIYDTPGTGAHALRGAVLDAWIAQGWELGPLGYATGDLDCGLPGSGCKQQFQGGTLYSRPDAGTHAVSGPLAQAWSAVGAESGPLRFPVTGRICGMKESGCVQVFQGGRIYHTPGTGAHALRGAVLDAWIAQGWELGPLGYATGDLTCGLAGWGCSQQFQGGSVHSSPTTGAFAVSGAVASAWTAVGGESGALGYPVTGRICGMKESGCVQVFQGGRIYDTPGTGARALRGAVLDAWIAQGWELGPLGYATGDQTCVPGGACEQQFQGGVVYVHPTLGTRTVTGVFAVAHASAGAETGVLGYPVFRMICGLKGDGCAQVFQGGVLYTSPASGTHAIRGAIAEAWFAQDYERGSLGYPVGDLSCDPGGASCTQDFQGGTLTVDNGTGRVTRS